MTSGGAPWSCNSAIALRVVAGPLPLPDDWLTLLNVALPEDHLHAIRVCAHDGRPYGSDAWVDDIRKWYVQRFLRLRQTAFSNPSSYFHRYAALTDQEAVDRANQIWREINGPNLVENILPTRSRATLVLSKGENHEVRRVRLRKI